MAYQTKTVAGGWPLPPISEIEPNLYIGDMRDTLDYESLKALKISAIISLVADTHNRWRQPTFNDYVRVTDHLYIQCEDSSTQNLLPYFESICRFIDTRLLDNQILVHCERGISRSPTAVIAYLMWKHGLSHEHATQLVKTKRRMRPSANFRDQLQVWEQCQYQLWQDEARLQPKALYAEFLERRSVRLAELNLTGDEPIGFAARWSEVLQQEQVTTTIQKSDANKTLQAEHEKDENIENGAAAESHEISVNEGTFRKLVTMARKPARLVDNRVFCDYTIIDFNNPRS